MMKKFLSDLRGSGWLIAIVIIAILAIAGGIYYYVSYSCIEGSGNVQSQERIMDDFHSINYTGQGTILLWQSDHQSFLAKADDNILKNLKTKVVDGVLYVTYEDDVKKCFKPSETPTFKISMMQIKNITLNGQVSLHGKTPFTNEQITVETNGKSQATLTVNTMQLDSTVNGSGMIRYFGLADQANFTANGTAKLYGIDLITKQSKINVNGEGRAEVSATEKLDININGLGNVVYKGNPEITQNISGSGKVQKLEGEIIFPSEQIDEEPAADNESSDESSITETDPQELVELLKQALKNKHADWQNKELDLSIAETTNKLAFGTVKEQGEMAGGGYFFAALTDDGWVIAADGQGTINCAGIEPYNFPNTWLPECYDENTQQMKER